MKHLVVALALLGMSAPVFADEVASDVDAVVMTDAELEAVAAGRERGTLNLNISPVIFVQRNTALTVQIAIGNGGNVSQDAVTLQRNRGRVSLVVRMGR